MILDWALFVPNGLKAQRGEGQAEVNNKITLFGSLAK